MSGGRGLTAFSMKKRWNSHTDGVPHVHLAKVDEDGHQSDGVGRKML
jgi:hypothetical protein